MTEWYDKITHLVFGVSLIASGSYRVFRQVRHGHTVCSVQLCRHVAPIRQNDYSIVDKGLYQLSYDIMRQNGNTVNSVPKGAIFITTDMGNTYASRQKNCSKWHSDCLFAIRQATAH